ncbi:hypothetical protein U1Q18_037870 [Sarracenia purpurea var. burkii]
MGEVNIPNSGTDFVQISGDNSSKPAFELPSEEKGVNGSDLVHKAHSEGANVGASQMLDKMPQRNRDIAEVKQDQSIPKKTWAHIVGSKVPPATGGRFLVKAANHSYKLPSLSILEAAHQGGFLFDSSSYEVGFSYGWLGHLWSSLCLIFDLK